MHNGQTFDCEVEGIAETPFSQPGAIERDFRGGPAAQDPIGVRHHILNRTPARLPRGAECFPWPARHWAKGGFEPFDA